MIITFGPQNSLVGIDKKDIKMLPNIASNMFIAMCLLPKLTIGKTKYLGEMMQ